METNRRKSPVLSSSVLSETSLTWRPRSPLRSINKLIVAHVINAAFVPIFVQVHPTTNPKPPTQPNHSKPRPIS